MREVRGRAVYPWLSESRPPWTVKSDLPPLARFLAGEPLPDWVHGVHQSRAGTTPVAPSFAASIDRAVRSDLAAHAGGLEPLRWKMRQRVRTTEWLNRHGYLTAEVMHSGFPLEELPDRLQGLERFVIKPTDAHSSLGVMALLREGRGFSFLSVETGRRYDLTDLMDALAQPMEAFEFPDCWHIEELLLPVGGTPGVLTDFKFYAFQGQLPLVLLARGRGEKRRYAWFDQEWSPVRTGKYENSLDVDLAPVGDPAALMDVARRLSLEMPVAFCRIDLYETSKGVVVGELTPEPGEYHRFEPRVDLYLGSCFELACVGSICAERTGVRL